MKTYIPIRLVVTRGEAESGLRDGSLLTKCHAIAGNDPVMDGWVEILPPRRQGMGFEVCLDDGITGEEKPLSWIQQKAIEKAAEREAAREAAIATEQEAIRLRMEKESVTVDPEVTV